MLSFFTFFIKSLLSAKCASSLLFISIVQYVGSELPLKCGNTVFFTCQIFDIKHDKEKLMRDQMLLPLVDQILFQFSFHSVTV